MLDDITGSLINTLRSVVVVVVVVGLWGDGGE